MKIRRVVRYLRNSHLGWAVCYRVDGQIRFECDAKGKPRTFSSRAEARIVAEYSMLVTP